MYHINPEFDVHKWKNKREALHRRTHPSVITHSPSGALCLIERRDVRDFTRRNPVKRIPSIMTSLQ